MAKNVKASKPWVKEQNLCQRDKNILLPEKEWLSPDIKHAAQHLCKDINAALSSFQNIACGLVLNSVLKQGNLFKSFME